MPSQHTLLTDLAYETGPQAVADVGVGVWVWVGARAYAPDFVVLDRTIEFTILSI